PPSHPFPYTTLFRSRELFAELLAWSGEGCGKPVVQAHAREALHVDWPPAMLEDVDTPEDLERVTGRSASGGGFPSLTQRGVHARDRKSTRLNSSHVK